MNLRQVTQLFSILLLAASCGTPTPQVAAVDVNAGDEAPNRFGDAVTDVNQSPVKRQAIGNCWIYATASWAESLHKTAVGEEVNLSESYWTYWHWFDQIADGWVDTSVQTGGSYDVAREIIRSYGAMLEADFIPEEATVELSSRQAQALSAINESLTSGLLSDPNQRTRENIRAELNKAFGLRAETVAWIDQVFGPGVVRNLRTSRTSTAGTPIKRSTALSAWYKSASGKKVKTTLKTALNQFEEDSYPDGADDRREYLKRVQRALHDKQPLILTWFVDFNSMNAQGQFLTVPDAPGRQGGHMVVVEDYEVDNVPGYGTLPAGVEETREEALDAALSDDAQVKFFRIKNSWGTNRVAPADGFAGYHDLYMDYMNGPIAQCRTNAAGESTTDCPWQTVPFTSIAFPRGY